ncbi:ornithine decarboxylase 1-like [Anopheles moucheti]|uniref:ornithine decarboxylase 1-like n=1 Tax=Anopheles moucheti TaxID=186751 RepID=UPI0022EFE42E|nr:ornithine decarboxylase 1-like [Anopheles moucheti]
MESPPEISGVFASTTTELVQRFVCSGDAESPINILDLDEIAHNYHRWNESHPYAIAYYLPSVNNHPAVLTLLSKLGLGFSCASVMEMRSVLKNGVAPDRIVLAHPAKAPETILYAKQKDIRRIVCDSVQEIGKVHRLYPAAQIILRIRVFSGQKFGCCPTEGVREIFNYAASTGVTIAGIHIAVPEKSAFDEVETLRRALQIAKDSLDQANTAGLSDIRQLILSGTEQVSADQLQQTLAEFNIGSTLPIIIETERLLVQSAVTLITSVQSKRVIRQSGTAGPVQEIMYFINDGRYGSFEWWNAVDKHPVVFRANKTISTAASTHPSSLWGPSCDSADIVCERLDLPELEIGDYLVFPGMGAYGVTLASCFNGFPIPKTVVCARLETTRALVEGSLSGV